MIILVFVSCSKNNVSHIVNQKQQEMAQQRSIIANTIKYSSLHFKGKRSFSSVDSSPDVDKDLDSNIIKRKQILRAIKD
ncbi:MAG: hypothetical protein OEY33_08530 [Bdellovibrionales bacterium]|jgi:hypothetical protein|nr:hypothetical protein [Bdellovibrionales bacterium]